MKLRECLRRCAIGLSLILTLCVLLHTACKTDKAPASCGDQICGYPNETVESCPEDCQGVCGNAVLDADHGEECDATDFGGLTCLDVGLCVGGVLTCNADCTLNTIACMNCN